MTSPSTTSRALLALVAVASIGVGTSACGSDDDGGSSADTTEQTAAEITVTDAWSRKPADGQTTSAVYGVITNGTDDTVTAVSASTDVTSTAELHEVLMSDDGKMSMQEMEGGYEIPAGETLTLEPGGAHIMLLDIDPATYPDTVEVTLNFDDDTSVTFDAEVRSIDDTMNDASMGDMDMPETTDG